MANKSFVMYDSWMEMVEDMTTEEAGLLLKAIYAYRKDKDYKPEDRSIRNAFNILKQRLNEDEDAYQQKVEKRAEAGKMGGRPKANESNEKQTEAKKANAFSEKQKNPESESEFESESVYESESESVEKKEKRVRASFVRPTVEEVADYCIERKNSVDPEQFVNFYDAKGWKIGKEAMKDWKAAVRTWEKRETREPPKAQPKARQPDKWQYQDQRVYDYDALEQKLLERWSG